MARQTFFERRTAERAAVITTLRKIITLCQQEQLQDILNERFKQDLDNFEKVQRLLPFQTELRSGNNFVHIVNKGAKRVELSNGTTIHEHDTLCRRSGRLYADARGLECPGCLAIGAGLAVRESM